MRRSRGRSGGGLCGCVLLALVAAMLPAANTAGAAEPRRRLELAGGVHEDVVPTAVDGEQSLWRSWDGADAGGGEIAFPTRQIVGWGRCPSLPQGPIVILADGGLIAGRIEAADDTFVTVRSATLGRLVLPVASVAGWRAGPSLGPGPLHASVPIHDTSARVLLDNGDELTARKATWRDGRLTITVRTGGVTVPESVVRAIDFGRFRPRRESAGAQLRIQAALADGSWFEIESLRSDSAGGPAGRADAAGRLAIVTAAWLGSQAAECFATDLVALAIDGGVVTRLGAHEPVAFVQTPVLAEESPAWPLGRNRTVTGGWPTLRGETSIAAIGMHAPAVARFAVPARGGRFEGRVGVDDTAGAGGSVVVRVRTIADDAAARDAFVSPVMRGGDRPLDVRVDLGPATSVELVVEPADGGDVLDRVLWLDPRVVVPDGR